MTFKELQERLKKYNIPEDVHFLSNSGWECSATEMDGLWYNKEENELHFTQDFDEWQYEDNKDYIPLK